MTLIEPSPAKLRALPVVLGKDGVLTRKDQRVAAAGQLRL
jgi:hypothetical protein